MTTKNTSLAGLLVMLCLVTACSTQHNVAPVLERNADGKLTEIPRPPTEGTAGVPNKPRDERGYYTVKRGDTLSHIALDNGQNYRDLVTWNNLADPNDIKVDQVLRVLPPDAAGGNVQVSGVPMPAAGVRAPLAPLGSSVAVPPVVAATNKTGPRGEKRPYSEAALADLQKSDAPVAVAVPTMASSAVPKTIEPSADAAVAVDDAVVWAWPADGKPTGPYDEAKKGIDIAGSKGQSVMAAASGKVLYVGVMRGYGNLVIVKHSGSLLSAYAHNKSILVKEGQVVAKGQEIAEMGDSDADAVKLHFEVRQQGKPVDPAKFLPPR